MAFNTENLQCPAHTGCLPAVDPSANPKGTTNDLTTILAFNASETGFSAPAHAERFQPGPSDVKSDVPSNLYPHSLAYSRSWHSSHSDESGNSYGPSEVSTRSQESSQARSSTSEKSKRLWNLSPRIYRGPLLADPSFSKLHHEAPDEYRVTELPPSDLECDDVPAYPGEDDASPSEPSEGDVQPAPDVVFLGQRMGDPSMPVEPRISQIREAERDGCKGSDDRPSGSDVDIEKNHSDEEKTPDQTDALHLRLLKLRATFSRIRKVVLILSVIGAILATVAAIILLSLSKSKKMERAIFMGYAGVIELAIISGMIAIDSTKVEVFMAATLVLVAGIFLTAQIDALNGYS